MKPGPEDRAEMAESSDNTPPQRDHQVLPVVGLGGSAGSLAALQTFFEKMPAERFSPLECALG